MNVHAPATSQPIEEESLFEMANLYPRHTGLPMTVWVSPRGHARHDARIKVCRTHGDRMNIDDTAVVGIRPTPELIDGPLAPADLKAVQAWISLNAEVLIGYWNGELDTIDMGQALERL